MSKQIKLTIPMRIFPKHTVREGKHGNFYTPKGDEEKNLKDFFFQFTRENRLKPFTANLRVDCIYYCKNLAPCDKDNADKTIGDCGQGYLWRNDRQIKDGRTRFIEHSDEDKIEITIVEVKKGG